MQGGFTERRQLRCHLFHEIDHILWSNNKSNSSWKRRRHLYDPQAGPEMDGQYAVTSYHPSLLPPSKGPLSPVSVPPWYVACLPTPMVLDCANFAEYRPGPPWWRRASWPPTAVPELDLQPALPHARIPHKALYLTRTGCGLWGALPTS